MYYPSKILIYSILFLLLFFMFSLFLLKSISMVAINLTIIMFLSIFFLLLLFKKVFVELKEEEFRVAAPFRKVQIVKWEEVTTINYSINSGLLKFDIGWKNGKNIAIYGYNHLDLYRNLLSHLSDDKKGIENYVHDLELLLQVDRKRKIRYFSLTTLSLLIIVIAFYIIN